jgi:dephospho-CoA kinase
VGKAGKKPIIGIIGGIGSGKSTVAAEFAKLGAKVIDADKIAHELLDKKNVKIKITEVFGPEILEQKRKINHRKLAGIVFSNAQKLALLNSIVHPLVLKQSEELIKKYKNQKKVKAIVLDMPLLVEVGWHKICDKLIFVDCNQKIRAKRAQKMGLNKNQLKIRENFQISLDKKLKLTDNTIENNSGISALARQVADIFSYIVGNT